MNKMDVRRLRAFHPPGEPKDDPPNLSTHYLAWTPTWWGQLSDRPDPLAGKVALVPLGTDTPLRMTGVGCWVALRTAPWWERRLALFIEINTLIQRDGIEPSAVHAALSPLAEYRGCIPPDLQLVGPQEH